MAGASNYTENNILNAMLRGQEFPLPDESYISLHTGPPDDDGSNEVSLAAWPAYRRIDATEGSTLESAWSAPADGVSQNLKELFSAVQNATGSIEITHFGIWDAITGGNFLNDGELDTPITLNLGDVFEIEPGALKVTVK